MLDQIKIKSEELLALGAQGISTELIDELLTLIADAINVSDSEELQDLLQFWAIKQQRLQAYLNM